LERIELKEKIKEKVLEELKRKDSEIKKSVSACFYDNNLTYRATEIRTYIFRAIDLTIQETSKQIFDDIDELMEDGILPTSPSYEELKKKWCK